MNAFGDHELPVSQYDDEVKQYIMLLNESFVIQTKKLEAAYVDGIITEREYDQWLNFFDTARREWLAMDLTKPENILFLAAMAKHNMEIAQKMKFTHLPHRR